MPRPLPKALGVDEAVLLADFAQPAADPWLEARDAAMVELLYGSGLRVGELAGLDVAPSSEAERQGRGWIDLQAGEVHVRGKGGKRRSVPMGAAAQQALQAWLALRAVPFGAQVQGAVDAALFLGRRGKRLTTQSIWARVRQRSQQAGLRSPVHPHMLRHSFASHVLQSSGDLRAVQELLGHASIASTQVYTRLDFQHLAKVYDGAHPRTRAPARTAQGITLTPDSLQISLHYTLSHPGRLTGSWCAPSCLLSWLEVKFHGKGHRALNRREVALYTNEHQRKAKWKKSSAKFLPKV